MKTVVGKVVSTTPVSLSKAASILSKFVSADTGASQAVCAYLQRASLSFNELRQFHKDIESNRKHKKSKSEFTTEDKKPMVNVLSNQEQSRLEVNQEPGGEDCAGVESERKKHKKKEDRGWFGKIPENGGKVVEGKIRTESDLEVEIVKRKHKKKIKIEKVDEDEGKAADEEDGNAGIESQTKKHKKKEKHADEINNFKENGDVIVIKKERKRKSREIEEEREIQYDDSLNKKKRKIEGTVHGSNDVIMAGEENELIKIPSNHTQGCLNR